MSRRIGWRLVLLPTLMLGAGLAACRGEAPRPPGDPGLTQLVDSLVPPVERATGLKFVRHPRAALITREQAHAYLATQLDRQLGHGRGKHLTDVYRLLGLLPDSIDLARLYLDVLTEQVAGYYDPDSSAFFGVAGASPVVLRLTVAHELVHALQHDYLPLDSIMNARDNADRLLAAQSVLEGQATLAMLRMQPSVGDKVLEADFWEAARDQATIQQRSMPELRAAPRLLQEALVFPYFAGAEYMRWWMLHHPAGVEPYGAAMPRSSEEILAPDRVAAGDPPLGITLTGGPPPAYSDVLGAAELRVLIAVARGQEGLVDPAVLGWGGDRFALYYVHGRPALLWYAVFDSPVARAAALRALGAWPPVRAEYRTRIEPMPISGRAGVRLVVAPSDWRQWSTLPVATAAPERGQSDR